MVDAVAASPSRAEALGGTIAQPAQQVPGVSFGVLADVTGTGSIRGFQAEGAGADERS
jgi:hypothetical protein